MNWREQQKRLKTLTPEQFKALLEEQEAARLGRIRAAQSSPNFRDPRTLTKFNVHVRRKT